MRERSHESRCFERKRAGYLNGREISSSTVYTNTSEALLLEDADAEPLDTEQMCVLTLPGCDTPMTLGEALAKIAAGNAGELDAVVEEEYDDEDSYLSSRSASLKVHASQRQPRQPCEVGKVEPAQEEHEEQDDEKQSDTEELAPRHDHISMAAAAERRDFHLKPSVATWLKPLPMQTRFVPAVGEEVLLRSLNDANVPAPHGDESHEGSSISVSTTFAEEQEENATDLMMILTSAADLRKGEQDCSFKASATPQMTRVS